MSADGRYIAFDSMRAVWIYDQFAGTTIRVTAHGEGFFPSLSPDGRYVAFASHDVAFGISNGTRQIVLHDLQAGISSLVSVSSSAMLANAESDFPSLSTDGRFVAFVSYASNLVSGDTNGTWDIFVRDMAEGTTTRVSVSSAGGQGDGESGGASISADGRYVAFQSLSSNLVDQDINSASDIFVRDRTIGRTVLASVSSGGVLGAAQSGAPVLSADGRHVVFESDAPNLVPVDTNPGRDVFVRDLDSGATALASVSSSGQQALAAASSGAVSADGRHVVFSSEGAGLVPDDTNQLGDVFIRDRGQITCTSGSRAEGRVSTAVAGREDSVGPAADIVHAVLCLLAPLQL